MQNIRQYEKSAYRMHSFTLETIFMKKQDLVNWHM